MQIDGIQIRNFLSFDSFSWSGLDQQLNIIVGPNGTGKTNLFHALRAVKDALAFERKQDAPLWSQQTHLNSVNPLIEITLDIRFNSEWEKQLLCTFVAAAICDERTIRDINPGQFNPDELVQLSEFLLENLRPEIIAWLFEGRLFVIYDGLNWDAIPIYV